MGCLPRRCPRCRTTVARCARRGRRCRRRCGPRSPAGSARRWSPPGSPAPASPGASPPCSSTADGGRAFVKAAPAAEQPHLVDWYAREAAILDRLPRRPAGAPPAVDALRGRLVRALHSTPSTGTPRACPGRRPSWTATLTGYAQVAAALADPPAELTALGLPQLADLARADILWWEEVAAGREPLPALPPAARGRLPELVALESLLPGYAAGAHRPDPRRPAGGQRAASTPTGAPGSATGPGLCSRAGLVRPGRPAAHRVRRRAGRGRGSSPRTRRPPALPRTRWTPPWPRWPATTSPAPTRHRRLPRHTGRRTNGGAGSRRSTGSPAARAGGNCGAAASAAWRPRSAAARDRLGFLEVGLSAAGGHPGFQEGGRPVDAHDPSGTPFPAEPFWLVPGDLVTWLFAQR